MAATIEAPQRGSIRSVYEANGSFFYQVMYHSSGGLWAPPVKSVLTSLCTCFRTGSCSPVPLMVTGQPLLIVWKICPSMSVRMKISLVSWRASTETDPKAGGESPPGTSSWFLHQLTRFILNQLKASLKHLTFKAVFLLALGSGKRRSEIHAWQTAQHH